MNQPNTLSDRDLDERVQRILTADVSQGWNQPLEALDHDLGVLTQGILSSGNGSLVLDERQQHVLKYGLLFAVHWYGGNRRKIGNHFYFNHVYKAAQWRVRLDGHEERPYIFLTDLLSILFHDTVEEVVARRLREEIKSSLQDRALSDFTPEDRRYFMAFHNVGQEIGRIHLPAYLSDFDNYKEKYHDLFFGWRRRYTIHTSFRVPTLRDGSPDSSLMDVTKNDLNFYFRLAERHIVALNQQVVARERELIDEEFSRFNREFFRGLMRLPVSKKPLRHMARDVLFAVQTLTRIGSELYYGATGKLFAPKPGYRSLRTKFCDRLANTSDLKPGDRQTEIVVGGKPHTFRYFRFDPSAARVDFAPFLEPSESITFTYDGRVGGMPTAVQSAIRRYHIALRNQAQDFLADRTHLDICSFFELSEEQTNFPGIRELNKQLYGITRANARAHHYDTDAESRAKIKTRLPAPDRLYQLYKNIILVTHTRMFYEGKRVPTFISRGMGELLELTRAEAVSMIEGVFSNHCLPGGSFTLHDARRLYGELKEYESAGGFDSVTEEVPQDNTRERRPLLSYDGLLGRFFDKRVRGRKSATNVLYQDKSLMFAASLALHRLAERYIDDRRFYIQGLTFEGLRPEKPIVVHQV